MDDRWLRRAANRIDQERSAHLGPDVAEAGRFRRVQVPVEVEAEYEPKAATALTQPILLDRIIGFRGFKSIAFVGTQSETVHAIDIDMGAPLWKYHINYSASPPPMLNVTSSCPGGLVAPLSRATAIAPAAGGGGGFGG